MLVKINVNVTEQIYKAFESRDKSQNRIYGMLLGSIEGKDTFHIKHCILGALMESENGLEKDTKTLNTILQIYNTNYPKQVVLGGFSFENQLFNELHYLYTTINDLSKSKNTNKILLLFNSIITDNDTFRLKAYNWNYLENSQILLYNQINFTFNKVESFIPNPIYNEEEFLYILNDDKLLSTAEKFSFEKNFLEFFQKICNENEFSKTSTLSLANINLKVMKYKLQFIEKFLTLTEEYLDKVIQNPDTKQNNEILNLISSLISQIGSFFESDENLKVIQDELKQQQITDYLTNLVNLQMSITEKINNKFINN